MQHLSKLFFTALLPTLVMGLGLQESFAYQSLDGTIGLMNQAILAERPGVTTAKWAGSCVSCHTDGMNPGASLRPFGQLLIQPAPAPAFGRMAPTVLNQELRNRIKYVIGNDPMSGQPFDSDQDGASNLAEIDAGTDPGSALSKPGGGSTPTGPALGRDQSGLSVGAPAKSMKSTAGCGEKKTDARADVSHVLLFGVPLFIAQGLRRRKRNSK